MYTAEFVNGNAARLLHGSLLLNVLLLERSRHIKNKGKELRPERRLNKKKWQE